MDKIIKVSWFRRQKNKWLIAAGFCTIFVISAYAFWANDNGTRIRRDDVIIGTAERGIFNDYISISGKVEPIQTVYLDVQDGGRVERVLKRAGEYVNAGDTIVAFTNSALLLDLTSREAQLFEQQNNLQNTRINMDRYSLESDAEIMAVEHELELAQRKNNQNTTLHERHLISDEQYNTTCEDYEYLLKRHKLLIRKREQDSIFYKEQIGALENSVKRIKSNLALVDRSLAQLNLCAPVSGFLTSQSAEIGQSIPAGTRIGRIDILDGFKISSELDEYYLNEVEIGQTGQFEIGGNEYGARVSKIYPEVTNGKFTLDLSLDNDTVAGIKRGQTLKIRLELNPAAESVILPNGAFFQSTGGRWIYVVDESLNIATRREIELGRQNPQAFEILNGLQPGEKVIISSYKPFGNAERLILVE